MIKVAIATKSAEKIAGIKEAMYRIYKAKQEIQFYYKAVESGVSIQPFGEETYLGAINRLHKIKKEFPEMDYYVSCEAGIEETFGQFFNVQVVCVETRDRKTLWGKSAGLSIPPEHIEKIKAGTLDSYLRGKGISKIEEITGMSRREFITQATELALASEKLQRSRNNWGFDTSIVSFLNVKTLHIIKKTLGTLNFVHKKIKNYTIYNVKKT